MTVSPTARNEDLMLNVPDLTDELDIRVFDQVPPDRLTTDSQKDDACIRPRKWSGALTVWLATGSKGRQDHSGGPLQG